jgi:hypothetical protein
MKLPPLEFKINPICPECTGYCDTIVLNGQEWLKCRSCGFMKKINKREITPIAKEDHESR